MLTLGRRIGETILIGDDIRVTLSEIRSGEAARIRIDAPPSVRILRAEIACDACAGRGYCVDKHPLSDTLVRECCDACRGTGLRAGDRPCET